MPSDVLEKARGRTISFEFPAQGEDPACRVTTTFGEFSKVSLRTRSESVAKVRKAIVLATLGSLYAALRRGERELSMAEVATLARDVASNLDSLTGSILLGVFVSFGYRTDRSRIGKAPGRSGEAAVEAVMWNETAIDSAIAGLRPGTIAKIAEACGAAVDDAILRTIGFVPKHVRERILVHVALAYRKLVDERGREARTHLAALGEIIPDPPHAAMVRPSVASSSAPGITLTALFDRWSAEQKPAASTKSTWKGAIASLRNHIGHEDAGHLSADDVVAWKDAMVAAGRAAKGINDSSLAALRAILAYGVRNRLVAENVAIGVRVETRRRAGEGRLPYTDDDVARLLDLATKATNPAQRWLPWLAALSGARIGELAQLWGNRIRTVDGITAMDIAPASDGGSLKNAGSERTVPIHSAIIADGFLDFVRSRGDGPLFYGRPGRPVRATKAEGRHASKGVTNHLAAWIRKSGFTDLRKSPLHATRHWWKTKASRAGISDRLADAIQGHAPASEAARYFHAEITDMASAIELITPPQVKNAKGGLGASDEASVSESS